jgi:hypothetical protein
LDALAEPTLIRLPFRQREPREDGLILYLNVAFLCYLYRSVTGLGEILEGFTHLLFGLHIELVVREAHAVRVV